MARFLFAVFLFLPVQAAAASPEPLNLFRSGLKMFAAMAVVLGIMLLFHVMSKKGFKLLEARQGGKIRILESRPVGGRKALCLVEVDGERLLLGIGTDRVEKLHHFSDLKKTASFEKELASAAEERS
mgnify:CR=1 FL=1